jgi:hypothetical protein
VIIMSIRRKLTKEAKIVAITTVYFLLWFGVLMLLKQLILAGYNISFSGLSKALVAALVVAKVVLVLDHVPLGVWVRRQRAWVDVLIRTLLYTLGVFIVMVIERAFSSRDEHGGFGSALVAVWRDRNMNQVWANVIIVASAMLAFNLFSVLRKKYGADSIVQSYLTPVAAEKPHDDEAA